MRPLALWGLVAALLVVNLYAGLAGLALVAGFGWGWRKGGPA